VKTVISSKGQVVIPAELREQDHIAPGQQFEIERIESGQYLLKKLCGPANEGVVDWLLECPEKDWFESVPSESTEDL
jgi:AbrB family looped-hinge helix DNA binding protein